MQNTTLFSCKITLVACKKLAENWQVAFDHLIRNNNNKTVLFTVSCGLICTSNTLAFVCQICFTFFLSYNVVFLVEDVNLLKTKLKAKRWRNILKTNSTWQSTPGIWEFSLKSSPTTYFKYKYVITVAELYKEKDW